MLGPGPAFDIIDGDVRVFSHDEPNMLRTLNRIPPLIFETIIFVLTMIKFYQSIQDGSGLMIFNFMTDGIWASVLLLSGYHPHQIISVHLMDNDSDAYD